LLLLPLSRQRVTTAMVTKWRMGLRTLFEILDAQQREWHCPPKMTFNK